MFFVTLQLIALAGFYGWQSGTKERGEIKCWTRPAARIEDGR